MGSVGPYRLQQPLILVCVGEGESRQNLVWYRNGRKFDDEMDPGVGRQDRQRNTLVIQALTRDMASNTFSCKVGLQFYMMI